MRRQFTLWLSTTILLVGLTSDSHGTAWRELLDQAKSLSKELYHDSAIVVAELALKEAKSEFGPEDSSVALVSHRLALFYFDIADYAKSDELNQIALALKRDVYGPRHIEVAKTLNNLGNTWLYQGRLLEAEQLYR